MKDRDKIMKLIDQILETGADIQLIVGMKCDETGFSNPWTVDVNNHLEQLALAGGLFGIIKELTGGNKDRENE